MAKYLISDIEQLSGVKAHILRRWENSVPFFSPTKDYRGCRFYSQRELEIILRMKHLVYDKKLSARKAGAQIIKDSEICEQKAQTIATVREIREQLGEMYLLLKKLTEACDRALRTTRKTD